MDGHRLSKIAILSSLTGAAIEVLKARGDWLFAERSAVGNLSSVWLVMPLLAGLNSSSTARGSARGLVSIMAALLGFYLAMVLILSDSWGSAGLRGGLGLAFAGARIWAVLAIPAGLTMGSLGCWLYTTGKSRAVFGLCGLICIMEPLTMALVSRIRIPVVNLEWWYQWNSVSLAEICVGFVLIVASFGIRQRSTNGRSSGLNT